MITYVKLQGEPKEKAMEALSDLSLDIPEVCVMDKALYSQLKDVYEIERGGFIYNPQQSVMNLDEGILTLFRGTNRVGHLKCHEVISKEGGKLGEYDMFYEWFEPPTKDQLKDLTERIDKVLKPLKAKYTLSTK